MLEEKGQPSQSQVGLQTPFQLQRLQLVLFIPPFPPLTVRPLSVLQCITNSYRENGYNSSLQLPDATLNFAKKHPLMEDKALARPLLLTKGVNFTKLVVDRVSALDQRAYNMLFIGTGNAKVSAPWTHPPVTEARYCSRMFFHSPFHVPAGVLSGSACIC